MSAYKKLNCCFRDLNNLTQSLKSLGFKPVINKEKKKLIGYQGDVRSEEADIVVPKGQISQASNDLGFVYNDDLKEYTMICSDYDLNRGLGDKVIQAYALEAIKSALKKNKFNMGVEKRKNKKIMLKVDKII